MTRLATVFTLTAALAFAAAAGSATTVASEAAAPGADFSNSHANPTAFASDVLTVSGAQNRKSDIDWLRFDGVAPGTERLDFTFTNPGGAWGGLNLRLKADPFKNVHDWWPLLGSWSLDGITDTRSLTVSYVLDGYTGPIHVALDFYDNDFRNGNGLVYDIAQVGGMVQPDLAPAPAPVPLPAGGALALGGLAMLAALRRSRR